MKTTTRLLLFGTVLTLSACGPQKGTDTAKDTTARDSSPPPRRSDPPPERRDPTPARGSPPAPTRARATPTTVTVSGTVKASAGQTLPAKAQVVLAWVVSAGSPDYVYIWGRGSVSGGRFTLRLGAKPPQKALNNGLMGVGMVLLLPATVTVPTGKLNRRAWRLLVRQIQGGADRYGVLWLHPAMAGRKIRILSPVKVGYSCGQGYKPATGTFERFRRVSCQSLVLRLGPFKSLRWVNWT